MNRNTTKTFEFTIEALEEKIRELERRLEAACDMADDAAGYTFYNDISRKAWREKVKLLREGSCGD